MVLPSVPKGRPQNHALPVDGLPTDAIGFPPFEVEPVRMPVDHRNASLAKEGIEADNRDLRLFAARLFTSDLGPIPPENLLDGNLVWLRFFRLIPL